VRVDWAAFGVDLHLELAPAAGRRFAIEQALREAIRAGRLPPATRLPSSRALAAELGVARGTVSTAYDQLVAEGFLHARTGSGTVVAGLPPPRTGATPTRAEPPLPRYNLRPGSPDVTSFPVAAWLRATRRALAGAPASAYGYGDPRGRVELRAALAEYLGRARGVLASVDQIVITSGYAHALALLTQVTGGAVAMEDPGLAFHRDVVRHHGARVLALPVDRRGARTDLLATTAYAAARMAVFTPAHQYPLGVTLHPDRRRAAVSWARERAGLVVEDDYDGEFRYDRQPVGALQGAAPEHVAYVGTAAKTLGPGLRLAWLVLPDRLMEPVVRARQHGDLHGEVIGQLALADMITSHAYDRHVRSCRLRYRRRRDLLIRRLEPLADRYAVTGVAAGLHVTVRLPTAGPGSVEAALLDRAAAAGVAVGDLASHWHGPGPHPAGLIVGYSSPGEGAYEAAVDRLVEALRTASV
jgi:GntR family transcriptional regulator/MocR family aminotransferase